MSGNGNGSKLLGTGRTVIEKDISAYLQYAATSSEYLIEVEYQGHGVKVKVTGAKTGHI